MRKLKTGEHYWYRIGDGDDYHQTDSLSTLSTKLRYGGKLRSNTQYGIITDKFYGNNYISVFIGDDEAQPIRSIPKSVLNKIMKR